MRTVEQEAEQELESSVEVEYVRPAGRSHAVLALLLPKAIPSGTCRYRGMLFFLGIFGLVLAEFTTVTLQLPQTGSFLLRRRQARHDP